MIFLFSIVRLLLLELKESLCFSDQPICAIIYISTIPASRKKREVKKINVVIVLCEHVQDFSLFHGCYYCKTITCQIALH